MATGEFFDCPDGGNSLRLRVRYDLPVGTRRACFVDVRSILVESGATFTWRSPTITLRDPNTGVAGVFTNRGVVRLASGWSRRLAGQLVNTGTLEQAGATVFSNAVLRNAVGGVLLLQDGSFDSASGTTNLLENFGTIRKVTTSSVSISVPARNAGLIDLIEGALSMTTLTQTDGETRIRRNRTLTVFNPVALQGGALTGAGTLSASLNATGNAQDPENPGTIAPGIDDPDLPDLKPLGILTLNGNLTMDADAVFEVEIAGTNNSDSANPQYDQLLIGGFTARTVQLNGILRLKGRDGYTPRLGDQFDVIVRTASSWTRTGEFRKVEVDFDTLPCVVPEVRYLPDRVRVVIARFADTPDTNRDGCVDDADLLAVLFAFGVTGRNRADVNCDGVVDGNDLVIVLEAFGNGC